jgi:nucleotide-binding universal stress UspA family protein
MASVGVILVGMDFSEHSAVALDRAVDYAKAFGAKIHLLHSYAVPVRGVMPYDFAVPDGVWDGIREAAETKLEGVRQRVESAGVEVSSEISPALPSEAILAAAEQIGADLIVMGTRGYTGLRHVLLGSVAERTIRLASCPVLTVKAEEES